MAESVPLEATDLTPLLKQARDLDVDAFCSFTYPPVSMFVYGQAAEIGYNPKAFLIGPGANFEFFKDPEFGGFGTEMVEGLIGFGA